MTAIKLSKTVGKSRSFLSVYRQMRGMPLKTEPSFIHATYQKELIRQDNARNAVQDMYYELKDNRNIRKFGLYLEEKDVMTHKSFNVMLGRSFMTMQRLIGIKAIESYENIVRLYEEWK